MFYKMTNQKIIGIINQNSIIRINYNQTIHDLFTVFNLEETYRDARIIPIPEEYASTIYVATLCVAHLYKSLPQTRCIVYQKLIRMSSIFLLLIRKQCCPDQETIQSCFNGIRFVPIANIDIHVICSIKVVGHDIRIIIPILTFHGGK